MSATIVPVGRQLAPHVMHAIIEHLQTRWVMACRNCNGTHHEVQAALELELGINRQWMREDAEAPKRIVALITCAGCAETRWLDLQRAGIDPYDDPIAVPTTSGPYR